MNSKALEAFLIPDIANEGFFDKFKSLKNNKKPEKIDPEKKKKLEIANNKYKLSTMTEDQYKQFISKVQKEANSFVKQMVSKANHDRGYIINLRNEFIKEYKDKDTGKLDEDSKELLSYIKPGYFMSNWDNDHWEIIEDQLIALICDLHTEIVESLNSKYPELSDAKIAWFSYGEGDEGCVYFDFASYESMKKKFNEVGITTEQFLIPIDENAEIAEENFSKNNLKIMAQGIAIAAITILGTKAMIRDYKHKKEIDKLNKEKETKSKAENEEYRKYLNSQDYRNDVMYVNKKYGINYTNQVKYMDDSDKKKLESKLNTFILADLKKMANAFNKNNKLCNELANKYIDFQSKDDPKYRDIATKEAEEIRTGPAIARQSEYAYDDENEFDVCDADQDVIIFMIDYIQEPFCNAINEKYAKEIKLGIMSKMRIIGDGDEGIIGYDYYNDFKR